MIHLGVSKVARKWFHLFFKQYINWNFKIATFVASTFPTNWNLQRQNMGYKLVYFVKGYNIPPTLVVNYDQIGVHLVPTARE
jgi:hypothetical protein